MLCHLPWHIAPVFCKTSGSGIFLLMNLIYSSDTERAFLLHVLDCDSVGPPCLSHTMTGSDLY